MAIAAFTGHSEASVIRELERLGYEVVDVPDNIMR
jgi:hypothetical protein